MTIFCLIYCIQGEWQFPTKSVALVSDPRTFRCYNIEDAYDVEYLMFYTPPTFLSECIFITIRVETVWILIRYEYNRNQLIFIEVFKKEKMGNW